MHCFARSYISNGEVTTTISACLMLEYFDGRSESVSLMASIGSDRTVGDQVIAHVRFGSKADICAATSHVRFTPNSDRESEIPRKAMSALPPKADMCGATRDVRFGPIADIGLVEVYKQPRGWLAPDVYQPQRRRPADPDPYARWSTCRNNLRGAVHTRL